MIDEGRRPPLPTVARSLAAVLLMATVTGCYAYSNVGYGGRDAPLRARIASTFEISSRSPTVDFAVSDRSHVAIFRVTPDGHARALYPYHPGGPSLFEPGAQAVFVDAPGRPFGHGGLFSSPDRRAACRGPAVGRPALSFVMLIASREPLRVDRLRGEVPFRLRPAVLSARLRGLSAFGTMDRLLARVIPAGLPDADWAVDWTYTSVQPARCARALERVAARTPSDAPDRESSDPADPEGPRLDPDSLRFLPPRLPSDPPGVTGAGPESVPSPVPPIAELPDVPGTPLDRPERPGRTDSAAGRRPERVVPPPGELSDHAGRLFGHGRPEGRSWRRSGGAAPGDRPLSPRARKWVKRLKAWASDPREHEFPEPPRTGFGRDRWRGSPAGPGVGEIPDAGRPGRWRTRSRGSVPGPGSRASEVEDRARVSPPRSPDVDREVEVREDTDEGSGGGGPDGNG